jgi:hypothetical protein
VPPRFGSTFSGSRRGRRSILDDVPRIAMNNRNKMLYEDDVVDSVCAYLKRRGLRITQKLRANQRGDDIVATADGGIRELHIEAKGETSSRRGGPRYGQEFNSAQVRDHVANAFFRAAQMATHGRLAGMALPKNTLHERYVGRIEHALDALGIIVFWVARDRRVTATRPLK